MDNNKVNQASTPADKELEIARQWIEYLKKKNASSTMLWVVFLVLALAASAGAVVQYLKLLEGQVLVAESQEENSNLLSQLNQKESQLGELAEQLVRANKTIDEKQALVSQLTDHSGEAGAQLELSGKLVSALKEKISKLEQDNALLEDALVESNKAYEKTVSERVSVKKKLAAQEELLSARSGAYQALVKRQKETKAEMVRLADELSDAKEREQSLDNRNRSLSRELKSVNAELETQKQKASQLAQESSDLGEKLKSLTTPIVPTARVKVPQEPKATSQVPAQVPVQVAPLKSEQAAVEPAETSGKTSKQPQPSSSPLDFGSISIE